MIHLIVAVLLILLLLYVAALYESAAFAFFAFLLAGLVLSAALLILWRMKAVTVHMTIPMALAESDQPVGVHFCVEAGRKLFGKARLRVQVEGRQLPGKKVTRTWLELCAPALGEETLRREVIMHCAGGYEYRLRRLRVYDWTGWFYLTKRTDQTAMTQLLPNIHELPLQLSGAVRSFCGEAEVYDDLRGGTNPAEVFQIRAYVPGDRLQNIHWKLSAKSEELMVREHSLPKGCPIVLLLGAKGLGRQKPLQRDRFLQIAASISFALMDTGCPHIVSWYDDTEGDLVRMRVEDEDSFYEWQLFYLTARTKRADVDVEVLYAKKYRSEAYLHCLCVEPELKVRLDGKQWHVFSKKGSLGEELGELQLYL